MHLYVFKFLSISHYECYYLSAIISHIYICCISEKPNKNNKFIVNNLTLFLLLIVVLISSNVLEEKLLP